MGYIIAFEGIEGSGKTTLAKKLAEELRKKGKSVIVIDEVPDESFGGLAMDALKQDMFISTGFKFGELSSFFYMLSLLTAKNKDSSLEADFIIFDRYLLSIALYQGYFISKQNVDYSYYINLYSTLLNFGLEKPDLSIILDIDTDICQRRIKERDNIDINNSDLSIIKFFRKIFKFLTTSDNTIIELNGVTSINENITTIIKKVNQ